MPIYEFECRSCGYHFDHLQKMSDEDPTVCPSCAAPALHHMVSAPSFRLAGSGWYETDFKGAGEKKHNLAGEGGHTKAVTANKTPATPAPAATASTGSASKS